MQTTAVNECGKFSDEILSCLWEIPVFVWVYVFSHTV